MIKIKSKSSDMEGSRLFKEEPPCNCQDCQRRHGECAEFTALNRPDYPYNREYCTWFLKESSAVGKLCFKCGKPLTQEDIDKVLEWAQTTDSDSGILVDEKIRYPDEEAVVCWRCHRIVESEVRIELLRKWER